MDFRAQGNEMRTSGSLRYAHLNAKESSPSSATTTPAADHQQKRRHGIHNGIGSYGSITAHHHQHQTLDNYNPAVLLLQPFIRDPNPNHALSGTPVALQEARLSGSGLSPPTPWRRFSKSKMIHPLRHQCCFRFDLPGILPLPEPNFGAPRTVGLGTDAQKGGEKSTGRRNFKATVNFNGEIFESPHYCTTLCQAEHSAAEVALNYLSNRGPSHFLATSILDKTGVYKNLLQEIAQRAGTPLPRYTTFRSGLGHLPVFTGVVELATMLHMRKPR
ncbi:hypothetical protein C1H46_035115 [Malus baccata]|uniref:DRBM domain-containing protein n=1 Tax=Malus baccata TaxID=106549 RepID=A0A540KYP0_MALBA|nr:hypothetical protein C1H46_035115 [Malus baccata]